jgi:hypothetical protein
MATSLATQLRPITPTRNQVYLIWSLAATISHHLLVVAGEHVTLAGLIPILATLFVQYVLFHDRSVHVSHTFALSIASSALGLVAHNILPYLMDEPSKMTITQPLVLHFGLTFCFLPELEWIRMRFYFGDRQASHPDLIVLPCQLHHFQAWLDTLRPEDISIANSFRYG